MIFWDSSAIVPLLVDDPHSVKAGKLLGGAQPMIVWWSTPVECASAIARAEREEALDAKGASEALRRLELLSARWQEVVPSDEVRWRAIRLLRVHPLRGADALQLAAASIMRDQAPKTLGFFSFDDRLNEAAMREGFTII